MKLYKIKKSNIDKRGLYASKNIKAGAKIINYVGKLITKKESQQNSKFDNNKEVSKKKKIKVNQKKAKSNYRLQLNDKVFVDFNFKKLKNFLPQCLSYHIKPRWKILKLKRIMKL